MAKSTTYSPRLRKLYNETLVNELKEELKLSNVHQLPKLNKITVNIGLGKSKDDKKMFEVANNTLRKITGQQPVETISRYSIASFKLREGQKVGMVVTLRGNQMYEFLDRLLSVVLPRLRDFHGVSITAFDRQGNYSIGLRDQSVFPELSFEETTTVHGLQINIGVNCLAPEHSKLLLEKMGMPFQKKESN